MSENKTIPVPEMEYYDKAKTKPKFQLAFHKEWNHILDSFERLNEYGKLDGLSEFWHANKRKRMEISYKNGKQHGPMTYWYENGVKSEIKHYRNGELHGAYIQWNNKGIRQQKAVFHKGEQVGELVAYDRNGKKILGFIK